MILLVQHRVRDFDEWKRVFEEHARVRKQHGASGHELYRVLDDPQDVVIMNHFPSKEQARAFAADPSLKEAMERGGVVGEPRIVWAEEIERVQY